MFGVFKRKNPFSMWRFFGIIFLIFGIINVPQSILYGQLIGIYGMVKAGKYPELAEYIIHPIGAIFVSLLVMAIPVALFVLFVFFRRHYRRQADKKIRYFRKKKREHYKKNLDNDSEDKKIYKYNNPECDAECNSEDKEGDKKDVRAKDTCATSDIDTHDNNTENETDDTGDNNTNQTDTNKNKTSQPPKNKCVQSPDEVDESRFMYVVSGDEDEPNTE